jgi:hypothetical protein
MTYEGTSATEATATEDTTQTEPILRRTLLKISATALGVVVLGASMQKVVQAAGAVETAAGVNVDKFMAASRYLIQHGLSPGVGARMVEILYAKIPTLDADLDAIISTAREKNSKVVEDFFDASPCWRLISYDSRWQLYESAHGASSRHRAAARGARHCRRGDHCAFEKLFRVHVPPTPEAEALHSSNE